MSYGASAAQWIRVPALLLRTRAARPDEGSYVAYVGRIGAEKGISTLLEAARLSRLPVRIAGQRDGTILPGPGADNVTFVGHLRRADIAEFLKGARYVVIPSICADVAPLAVLEAMATGLPVVASRIGGLPEMIPEALADSMADLWRDAPRLRAMGAAAREHVRFHHSEEAYYGRPMEIYSSLAA